jgi:predicted nucleotidyltransferase component of viral defense system
MKTSTQLKALIRNLSKENDVKAEVLLRNFMLERLLERISLSEYKNQFILKGGMLIAAIVGIDSRSTMDMDATIRGFKLTEEELKDVINKILAVAIDDGVLMTLGKLESIRDESEYSGIRISIKAVMDKTKQTMKVDITAGDTITPEAIEYPYKLLLEDRSIYVLAYNLETVFAEKLETILSRGTTTTRMRDYYDIYILTMLHEGDLNQDVLKEAFRKTSQHRGSFDNIKTNGLEYIQMIEKSKVLAERWEQYRSKNEYAFDVEWSDALQNVKKVFNKIMFS